MLQLAFCGTFLLMLQWIGGASVDFRADSLNKFIQIHSLLNGGSEEILYPGQALDPSREFSPVRGVYSIESRGRQIGQYPVLFTLMSAPFLWMGGPTGLAFFNWLTAMAGFCYFILRYRPAWSALLVATVASYFAFKVVAFSEFCLVGSLGLIGTDLIIRSRGLLQASIGAMILASIVWLRLEALVYGGTLGLFLLLQAKKELRTHYLLAALAGTLVLAAFLLFNWWNYEHPLGPRFLAQQGDFALGESVSAFFARKASIAVTLLFGNAATVGFFGFMPWMLIVTYFALQGKTTESYLGIFTVRKYVFMLYAYILLTVVLAPNDGVSGFGPRYLIMALTGFFPVIAVTLPYIFQGGGRLVKVSFVLLSLLSFGFTMAGVALHHITSRMIRETQLVVAEMEPDAILSCNAAIPEFLATEYFHYPILYTEDTKKMESLSQSLLDEANSVDTLLLAVAMEKDKGESMSQMQLGCLQGHGGPNVTRNSFSLSQDLRILREHSNPFYRLLLVNAAGKR